MDTNKIYIVVVNYNNWQDTIECLESVFKNTYNNFQIILVENNSSNNSLSSIMAWAEGKQAVVYSTSSQLKYLSQPFEKKPLEYVFYTEEEALNSTKHKKEAQYENPIIIIRAKNNNGFSAGSNIGMRYAIAKNDFEYIWLLNNDTVIEKSSLSLLIKYAKENKLGLAGSTLMYYYAPEKIQTYGGHINTFWGTANHIIRMEDVPKKLDYIAGASFLLKKETIEKIGLLPEEYFLYYEETDYCFNAKKNGFKLGINIKSIVYHKEGGSTKTYGEFLTRDEFIDVLFLRNRIKFHRKYLGGGIGLWIGLLIAFIIRIKRGQANRIYAVLRK